MVGDTVTVDGVEFEIVWSGGEGLIGDRRTKILGPWTPPKRLYNKTGNHSKKNKAKVEETLESVLEID